MSRSISAPNSSIEKQKDMETDQDLENRLSEAILTEHILLEGIPLLERPSLPRVPYNKTTLRITNAMNNVLKDHLDLIDGLKDISHWMYIAAKSVIMELGIKIEDKIKLPAVIQAYLFATKLETDKTGYLGRIQQYWQELYPQMAMSSQRISDQVRVICSRKFLSEVETENIKIMVSERLGMVQIENEEQPTEPLLERSMAIEAAPPEEDKDIDKLMESLLSQHVIYERIPLDVRPILSKIHYSFKSRLTVNQVNEALSRVIVDYPEMTVEAVCHWAYVAASVTTYTHKDENNRWIIKPYDDELDVDTIELVHHGDLVRLEHVPTGRNLHSHKEPAPITKKHLQVTGYGENGTGDPNDIWKIQIVNGKDGDIVTTVTAQLKLVHYLKHCVLTTTGKQLPTWAYEQQELPPSDLQCPPPDPQVVPTELQAPPSVPEETLTDPPNVIPPEQVLRLSSRPTKLPAHFPDYVME
ncbi:unnamed protein product [Nezara viridula]|uniref:MIR domain-containing protein n=1 Tax=Nezara viridula TaxID=85310 RepID=A0A9P0EA39_NEZVI|nr:unnamed protein product [Nezara viridula]